MAGFKQRGDDEDWFLYDDIEDTNFKGFGQYDKHFYLYLGKIDDTSEFQGYLEDLGVVLYRTEKKIAETKEKLPYFINKIKAVKKKMKKEENERASKGRSISTLTLSRFDREIKDLELQKEEIKERLSLMSTIFVGFIIDPKLNRDEFITKAKELVHQYDRYKLTLNSEDSISFKDISVELSVSST